MSSIFGILNMGAGAMSVDQQETAVTGQNLANVNNPAYADESLVVQESESDNTPWGQEGTGIKAVTISSLRNALLDAQIAAEGSTTGSLTSQQTALQQAEAYLNEQLSSSSSSSAAGADSANGLTADMSGLFSALQNLSTDPSNIADRQSVIQAAQQLTAQFNSVSSGLSTVTSDLNQSVQTGVAAANQDLSTIANLNSQIVYAQASGESAQQLVDAREKAIEDLSGYANITTSAQADGAINVSIGGVTMVSIGTTPDTLGTYTDANGNLQVQAQTAGTHLTLSGGSIEGSITARDGAIASLQSSLNTLASTLITSINGIYKPGYDLTGGTNQLFFTGTDATDIGVNSTLATDPSAFQASATSGATGDNTIVEQMAQLGTQSLAGLGNQTLSQNYAGTIATFGGAVQSVNEQLSNSSSVSQMLTTQRGSQEGVDTDTEMTNLLQFQKAYEASAELISTVNQMLQTVVNMKAS